MNSKNFLDLASPCFEILCQFATVLPAALLLFDISALLDILPLLDDLSSWGINIEVTTEITTEYTPNDEGLTEGEELPPTITGAGGPTPGEVEPDTTGSETDESIKDSDNDSTGNGSGSDSGSDTSNH